MQRHTLGIMVGDGSRQSRVLAMLLWLQLGGQSMQSSPGDPTKVLPQPQHLL